MNNGIKTCINVLKQMRAGFWCCVVHIHTPLHLSTPHSFLQISLFLSANWVLLSLAKGRRTVELVHFAVSVDILARERQDRQ